MELNYDWQSLQTMFNPGRRSFPGQAGEPTGPIHLVVDRGTIVSAFAEAEDLSDWVGAPCDELASERPNRELIVFEREDVDARIGASFALPHFHEQVEFLREELAPTVVSRSKTKKAKQALTVQRHFFFEGIQSWWGKVLPSAFGIFIRTEGQGGHDFFMVVRRGRLEQYHEPELSAMGPDRMRQPADVVKYLSEKYLVPVQGIFVSAQEWQEWSESHQPWRKVAVSIRAKRAKLVPFRMSLATLIATRGFLGL